MHLICGLDLGQSRDHSALCAVEKVRLDPPVYRRKWQYIVRLLNEYSLGLDYTDQVAEFVKVLSHPALRKSRVAVDYTGVGRPVYDMLAKARPPVLLFPMLTHAGKESTFDEDTREIHVPKLDVVTNLQILIQLGLIHAHPKLPTYERLTKQFEKYKLRMKESPLRKKKTETFGAESGFNDDLVSAVMTACWLGEHVGVGDVSGISVPGVGDVKGGSVVDGAPEGVFLQ